MKAVANAVRQDTPTEARTRRVPQKVEDLVAKAKYEAPKVVLFNLGQPKAGLTMPQITMAGNF
jgi:hypothetical protein